MSFDSGLGPRTAVNQKYQMIKQEMQRSGSDLGSKYIFAPPSGHQIDESTLNYIGRADSFRYLQDLLDEDANNRHTELQSFRNASDSFFKNQVRNRNPGHKQQTTGVREKKVADGIKEENLIDSARLVYRGGQDDDYEAEQSRRALMQTESREFEKVASSSLTALGRQAKRSISKSGR